MNPAKKAIARLKEWLSNLKDRHDKRITAPVDDVMKKHPWMEGTIIENLGVFAQHTSEFFFGGVGVGKNFFPSMLPVYVNRVKG